MADKISYSCTHLTEVDSTNRYIRDNATLLWSVAGDADALVVTTDVQSAGRGQPGNVWLSNAGENVLMSILLRPMFLEVYKQFALSQAVSLAIHDAMAVYGIDVELKWPNDIYVGNRKLAGILIELDSFGTTIEQAVIGIGLNVNQTVFNAMSRIPVSMKLLSGQCFSVNNIVNTILNCFSQRYAMLQKQNFEELSHNYKQLLKGYNKLCCYANSNGSFMARMTDVTPIGCVVLQRANGMVSQYAFKEVEQIIE